MKPRFLFIASALFLSVVLAIFYIYKIWSHDASAGWACFNLGLFFCVVSGVLAYRLLKKPDLLEPINLISLIFLLWYFYNPLYVLTVRPDEFDGSTAGVISTAVFYALLGYIFFIAGYLSPIGKKYGRRLPSIPFVPQLRSIWIIRIIAFAVGIAATSYFLSKVGGVINYWTTLVGTRQDVLQGLGYLILLTVVPLLASVWTYSVARSYGHKDRLGLVLIMAAAVIAVISGSRGRMILPILILCFYIYYWRFNPLFGSRAVSFATANRVAVKVAAAVLILLTISIAILGIRQSGNLVNPVVGAESYIERGGHVSTPRAISRSVFHTTLTGLWYLYLVNHVDNTENLRYGETLVQSLSIPIPRSIWPGKPLDSPGAQFGQLNSGIKTGEPYTLVGDFLWNFQVPGVIFGMLLYGIFLRLFYEWMKKPGLGVKEKIIRLLIYSTLAPVFVISSAGTFYGMIGTSLQYLSVLAFFVFLSAIKVRTAVGRRNP